MNRSVSLSAIAATLLLAMATTTHAQQSPQYVDVTNQATAGDLLTPEEQSRFDSMRKQAKSRAEINRIEAQESALLNQRVSERTAAALNQPGSPGMQSPSTAERPGSNVSPMGTGGMGSGTR